MNQNASDFDEILAATLLADLFDPTGSDDPDYVANKILDGLKNNGLLDQEDLDNDELMAA